MALLRPIACKCVFFWIVTFEKDSNIYTCVGLVETLELHFGHDMEC
jgi:hypothetical protein